MTERRGYTAKNAQFWEERGASTAHAGHVTLIAEHQRFVAYIHERELALLARLIGDRRPRVLDVGCGSGRLALAIARDCREVVGIDIAHSLIERARAAAAADGLTNVTLQQGGVAAPFLFGTFDLVMLSGVLNHLDDADAEAALAHAAASVAPGGTLYLRNNAGVHARVYKSGEDGGPPSIHRTRDEYLAMVRDLGLAVVEEHYLFPPLCLPNLVYYHALPARVRDTKPVGRVLDAWFAAEALTANARLRWLGPLYTPLLRAIGKQTALHVIVATKR